MNPKFYKVRVLNPPQWLTAKTQRFTKRDKNNYFQSVILNYSQQQAKPTQESIQRPSTQQTANNLPQRYLQKSNTEIQILQQSKILQDLQEQIKTLKTQISQRSLKQIENSIQEDDPSRRLPTYVMTENSEDNDENNMFKYLGSLCDVSYDVPKIVYESSISSEEESNFRFS